MKKKISFDFDSTLERKIIQEYAKELLLRDDIEVWIVTTRWNDDEKYKRFFHTTTNVEVTNRDLWEVAKELGIPKERVHFTNMWDKWHFFATHDNFIWHLDDDFTEIREIRNNTKTEAVECYLDPNWRKKCERILKEEI